MFDVDCAMRVLQSNDEKLSEGAATALAGASTDCDGPKHFAGANRGLGDVGFIETCEVK
jgi:hypothetical protein